MFVQTRREFVRNCAIQAGAVCAFTEGAMELGASPLGMPIGCQTWPVRNLIAKDFPGTIRMLAAAGFQTIELCSPYGYIDAGFSVLTKYSGADLRKILADA